MSEFLAENAVIRICSSDQIAHHLFGALVGLGDGIEETRRALVGDIDPTAKIRADDMSRSVGEARGEGNASFQFGIHEPVIAWGRFDFESSG